MSTADSGITGTGAPTPVPDALNALKTSLAQLIDALDNGGLDHLDHLQYCEYLREFEHLRNQLSVADHRAISDGERRLLPAEFGQGSMKMLLTHVLRISTAEAHRRVIAAEALGERWTMTGQPLGPRRPALALAQRHGESSVEQAGVINSALTTLERFHVHPDEIDEAETTLTRHARTFNPQELRYIAAHLIDAIHPDGDLPTDDLAQQRIRDRRHFSMHLNNDGTYSGEFRLTGAVGAMLNTILSPLTKPRNEKITTSNGTVKELPDDRTYGQRWHDGFEDMCLRLLQTGGLPDSGGTPATVIVLIELDALLAKTGHGQTSDGALMPVREVLKLANQAEIIPAVLSETGAILDLGRSRRIATKNQTLALIARDRGCSFPGCDHPPQWCERHHIIEWKDGGLTTISNLTLLCKYHHHNFADRGWTCRINPNGLPEWIPPTWVDRNQTPQINDRIAARNTARDHVRLPRCQPDNTEPDPKINTQTKLLPIP